MAQHRRAQRGEPCEIAGEGELEHGHPRRQSAQGIQLGHEPAPVGEIEAMGVGEETADRLPGLDPRNPEFLLRAAFNYGDQRHFETALRLIDRALQIRPGDVEIEAAKAVMYQAKGDLADQSLRPG